MRSECSDFSEYPEDEDSYEHVSPIKPIAFSHESINPQFSSPLFATIPPEIRTLIVEYALKDYEDESNPYDDTTCYKRPDYLAPRKCDTSLLRTCKMMYMEGWWLPYATAEHAFYLTSTERSPERVTTVEAMQKALEKLHKANVEPWFEHIRVFAQLYMLENGYELGKILDMEHFNPKSITLTIRHTDWWYWENDEHLRMNVDWVEVCRFPKSLKEFNVAFESVERRKEQIDEIVQQAIGSWEFLRKDGVVLSAEGCVPVITRWSGGSIWEHTRWLRDETSPGKLDYYVATVTWKPVYVKAPVQVTPEHGASVAEKPIPDPRKKRAKPLKASETHARFSLRLDRINVDIMERIGVSVDTPANEVIEKWETWRDQSYAGWGPLPIIHPPIAMPAYMGTVHPSDSESADDEDAYEDADDDDDGYDDNDGVDDDDSDEGAIYH